MSLLLSFFNSYTFSLFGTTEDGRHAIPKEPPARRPQATIPTLLLIAARFARSSNTFGDQLLSGRAESTSLTTRVSTSASGEMVERKGE